MPPKRKATTKVTTKATTKRRRPTVRRKRRRRRWRRRTTYRPSTSRTKSTVSDDDFIASDNEDDDDDDDDVDYEGSSGSSGIEDEAAQLIDEAPLAKRRRTQSAGTSSRRPPLDELDAWEDEDFLIAVQNSLLDLENSNKVACIRDSLVPDQNANASIPVSDQNGDVKLHDQSKDMSNASGRSSDMTNASGRSSDMANASERNSDMASPSGRNSDIANASGRSSDMDKRKGKEKVSEEDDVGVMQTSMASEDAGSVCGICLTEENLVQRGTLDCCDHFFCFDCIMEWAKVESRCPMCKQRFVTIAKSGNEQKRARKVRIPTRNQVYIPPEEDYMPAEEPYAEVVCMECHSNGEEGLLLLCDRCDSAAHTFCVGLGRTVPQGDWFCRTCQGLMAESSGSENQGVDLNLVFGNSDSDNDNDNDDGNNEGYAEYDEALIREIIASPETENQQVRQIRRRQPQRQGDSSSRMQVRSSTRRRILRRLTGTRSRTHAPPRLSRAARSLAEGILASQSSETPNLVSRAGSARTVPRQRMLQQRIQFMRNNWHLLQGGDLQFSSVHGNEEQRVTTGSRNVLPTTRNSTQSGLLSQPVIMSRNGTQPIALTSRNDPKPSVKVGSGPGEPSSRRDRDLDQAWEMMYHAKSLLSKNAQCSSDRTNLNSLTQVPSCTRTEAPTSRQPDQTNSANDGRLSDNRNLVITRTSAGIKETATSTLPGKANFADNEANTSNRSGFVANTSNKSDELDKTREASTSWKPGIKDSVTVEKGDPSTSRQPYIKDPDCGGNNIRNSEVNVGLTHNRKVETHTTPTSKQPGKTGSARHEESTSNNRNSRLSDADGPGSFGRSGGIKTQPSNVKEGLKVQLTEIVKKHIWPSYITEQLGKDQFKQIARTAVHTLLDLCEPKNETDNIYCEHLEKQGFSPIDNCCGKCFNEHVARVVKTAKEKVSQR